MPVTREDALEWINACAKGLPEKRDYLIQLDADYGANMDRGFQADMNKIPVMSDILLHDPQCC